MYNDSGRCKSKKSMGILHTGEKTSYGHIQILLKEMKMAGRQVVNIRTNLGRGLAEVVRFSIYYCDISNTLFK